LLAQSRKFGHIQTVFTMSKTSGQTRCTTHYPRLFTPVPLELLLTFAGLGLGHGVLHHTQLTGLPALIWEKGFSIWTRSSPMID